MIIAVVGSRDFPDRDVLEAVLDETVEPGDELISGGARGIDSWATTWAHNHDIPITEILPDWRVGRHAGLLRNTEIVNRAEHIIAFWDGKSRGTADTIRKARRDNVPILVIGPDGTIRPPTSIERWWAHRVSHTPLSSEPNTTQE